MAYTHPPAGIVHCELNEVGTAEEVEVILPTVELAEDDLTGAEVEVIIDEPLLLLVDIIELAADDVVVIEDAFVDVAVVVMDEDTLEQLPPGTLRTVIPGMSWSQFCPGFVLFRASKVTPSLAAIP